MMNAALAVAFALGTPLVCILVIAGAVVWRAMHPRRPPPPPKLCPACKGLGSFDDMPGQCFRCAGTGMVHP